ncbi:MAG: hypothetical protein HY305_00070 [Sphingobacteriales bacterium]|nr:hypothetical protein [Sphingobacteriales bacterium]
MQKKIYIIIVLFFSTLFLKAQTGIYRTYEDFVKGNIEMMSNEDAGYTTSTFGVRIKFKKFDGHHLRIKPKKMWGFLYRGYLFRTDHRNDIVFVADSGKVCLYENGYAYMDFIYHRENKYSSFVRVYYSYISSGLDNRIYRMPFYDGQNYMLSNRREYRKFIRRYPQYEKLYECIDQSVRYLKIRKCVVNYNLANK